MEEVKEIRKYADAMGVLRGLGGAVVVKFVQNVKT